LDEQFSKFMEVLKQLTVSIPFVDALLQMPSYAKFLKDILSNKRSLKDCKSVQLNHECSAVVSRELPPKLGDPGKFTIPCTIGKEDIKKALCDLGASVSLMPHTVFKRIGMGDLKPTRMTIQLADTSSRKPLGIVEDVPVRVGKFFVPADFVVMDMIEDKDVPIILGRPFLRTARAIFDTHEGTLTLNVGGEKVQFQIEKAMRYPDFSDDGIEDCFYIDDGIVLGEQEGQLGGRPNAFRYQSDPPSSLQGKYSPILTDGKAGGSSAAPGHTPCGPQGRSCGSQDPLGDPPDGPQTAVAQPAPPAAAHTPLLGTSRSAVPSRRPPEGKFHPPPTST
jgi:hypothetical protein